MSGRWVEVEPGRQVFVRDIPRVERASSDLPMPYVVSDIPAYVSPMGDGVIEGRAARREHFKRTNTREVDPSEIKGLRERFETRKADMAPILAEREQLKRL